MQKQHFLPGPDWGQEVFGPGSASPISVPGGSTSGAPREAGPSAMLDTQCPPRLTSDGSGNVICCLHLDREEMEAEEGRA